VYWLLAAIFIIVALTVPRLRPIGIAGCVLLGLMLIWGVVQRVRTESPDTQRGHPASPIAAVAAFPLEDLKAELLRIDGRGAPYELRGRMTNTSTQLKLRSFTAQIARRDCHVGALDPTGCDTLWQSRQWVELALAPGESREFVSPFWTRGDVPRARGTVRDDIQIVAADGQALTAGP
jgi:hypothetical protein